jgi:uncharacterized protein (UPF0332 family)
MEEQNKDKKMYEKAFQQFMDLFITPEVQRRQEAGELPKPLDLRAAQIIFYPDGRKPHVRINAEVKAIGKMKLKPGISKKVGEPIYDYELEGLEEIHLLEEDAPDCGHATLMRIGNSWTLVFDFHYNKILSKKHIQTAQQFLEAAEFSLQAKNWAPLVDNLFSASELVAKATLLSIPDPEFRKKASHKSIHIKYNRFADLGNVKVDYKTTFNKLSGLRDRARYLKGDFSISEEEARGFLDTIKNMLEDSKRIIKI